MPTDCYHHGRFPGDSCPICAVEETPFTPAKEQVKVRGWLLTYFYKTKSGVNGNGNLEHFRIGDGEPTFHDLREIKAKHLIDYPDFAEFMWSGVFKCGHCELDTFPEQLLNLLKADAEKIGVELI